MHDIKSIREAPESYQAQWMRRGVEVNVEELLALDEKRRNAIRARGHLETERKQLEPQLRASFISGGAYSSDLQHQLAILRSRIQARDTEAEEFESLLNARLAELPNIPSVLTPDGKSEADNRKLDGWQGTGKKREFDFEPRDHVALGEALGLMEFDTAANMSGARFVVLRGALARLERALGQYMLNHLTQVGYEEINVPLLVNARTMFGTGQLPKFENDLFKTTDGRYLIPTAEVSLTNLAANRIFEPEEMGERYDDAIGYTALTPCFRSEAGSAGRDTRGMIRQHQFNKVEMVILAPHERAEDQHCGMLQDASDILTNLGLHFEVVGLCAGDLGFSAKQTFDINVWLPGQGQYREISSVSNCGDFQARRMNARFRRERGAKPEFVHTLNGSGLAVGRTLVAIMETFQNSDGTIDIPKPLVPYMGGLEVIDKA